jgi:hypothetical protein
MPQINEDGTITIPVEIVRNMGGVPGQEVVLEEWLDPDGWPVEPIEEAKTLEVSVILKTEWDRGLKDRAQPLREFEPRSEHDICSEIESRIGMDILFTDNCSIESVFESNRWLCNREWMCGVHFTLRQCFTDNQSLAILEGLNDIDPSSILRQKQVKEIIERLLT